MRARDSKETRSVREDSCLEGHCRASSQYESVCDIRAGRVDHILKIRLEAEPWGQLDLICTLQKNFVVKGALSAKCRLLTLGRQELETAFSSESAIAT